LNFAEFKQQYGIQFQQDFKAELAELQKMQEDGLLAINTEGIHVSQAGRFLIRNICMVFDVYLRQGKTQTRFSKVI
jgi:oxygen-independent coproporphyrinogen-3 oxidase